MSTVLSRRALCAAAITCAALGVPHLAGIAAADPVCTQDPVSHAVVADFGPSDTDAAIVLSAQGSDEQIFASSDTAFVPCDGATTSNTETIAAHGPGLGGEIDFDAIASPDGFAPGRTPEATGLSEIELSATGFGTVLYAAPKNEVSTIHVGTKGISVNGDDDVDVIYTGATTVGVTAGEGDDTISAQGGDGSGKRLPADMAFQMPAGGGGNDVVVGHDGSDTIDLFGDTSGEVSGLGGDDTLVSGFRSGPYLLDGGPGNDTLRTRSGGATMLGGSGDDTFQLGNPAVAFGGAGDDTFDAENGAADVIHGDGGTDTARVDASDILTKVETVNQP